MYVYSQGQYINARTVRGTRGGEQTVPVGCDSLHVYMWRHNSWRALLDCDNCCDCFSFLFRSTVLNVTTDQGTQKHDMQNLQALCGNLLT